jgi:uncharacterized SAM-binding protein YcdF (DUF218 family)
VRWFRRHPIWTAIALLGLVAFLLVGGSAWTVWHAAHHDDSARIDHVDAIVVLGAAQYDGTPSPLFRERLDHAALLWRQGRADLVITVGSKQAGDRYTEAEAGRNYLIQQGVPPGQIVASDIGHTTLQSLQAAAHEMADRGLHTVFLVSDPWHNARISAMAADLGLDAYVSATPTSADVTRGSRAKGYLRETFAYLYYRLLGG